MYKIGDKLKCGFDISGICKFTTNEIYEIATQRQQDKKYVIFDDNNEAAYFDEDELGCFEKVDIRCQKSRPSGGSTHYYELPKNATELKHLIRHKKMSHPTGEAFCSLYRLNDNGEYKRNLEKAKYYIETELQYLEEGRE